MGYHPSLFLRRAGVLLGCLLFLFRLTAFAQIPDRPNPPHLVTDLAGILAEGERGALEQKLLHYEDSTSTQIAVVTVPDLHDYAVEQFADELALKWGIGQKGKE